MILVTGATGSIGGLVVDQLIAQGRLVRVLARDQKAMSERFRGQAEIAVAGLEQPESLTAPLAGVERVLLVAAGSNPEQQYSNLVESAVKAGVRHIVMLSALGADCESPIAMIRWFKTGEKSIQRSGLNWTFVRPAALMSNVLQWAASIRSQGAVFQPTGDGKLAYIDPRDVSDVCTLALTRPDYESRALEITGPEALSGADVTARIAVAIGRPLRFVDVPEEIARKGLSGGGLAPAVVDAVLEFQRDIRAGNASVVTAVVGEVLGRPPRTFDAWMREHIDAFK